MPHSAHSIERRTTCAPALGGCARRIFAVRPDGKSLRAQGQPSLPARFDSYIKAHVKLTADEYTQLLAGQPVTQHLETDPAKEVAIFGAVWVNAPMARYLERREGHRVV